MNQEVFRFLVDFVGSMVQITSFAQGGSYAKMLQNCSWAHTVVNEVNCLSFRASFLVASKDCLPMPTTMSNLVNEICRKPSLILHWIGNLNRNNHGCRGFELQRLAPLFLRATDEWDAVVVKAAK